MRTSLRARILILVQHLLERLAAVGRAEDAALRVRSVRMAEHRDEEPVRILRIDVDLRDHLALAQTEMRPRLAGVGRLVHAVARREIGANDARARADVDDVRIGRRDGDRADRSGRLLVEQRLPVRAVVGRAPHAAVVEADVDDVRLARHAGHRARAAGARRSDLAPVHGRGGIRLRGGTQKWNGAHHGGERHVKHRFMHDRFPRTDAVIWL